MKLFNDYLRTIYDFVLIKYILYILGSAIKILTDKIYFIILNNHLTS